MTVAIAIRGITLRTRTVRGEKRVEVVVHCADDEEQWIAQSEPLWSFDGIVDHHVTANGIKARPSQKCPVIGKAAMKKLEDREIAAGRMKPREQWGVPRFDTLFGQKMRSPRKRKRK